MESALRQRITPVRVLIAAQLAIIAVAGLATVFSLPRFTGDEAAHYSYVQSVAEEGRLPFLGTDLISPQAESIYEGVYPEPGKLDRRERGLGGYSYEAFQPPLTYLLAAPVFLAGGSDYVLKLRLLRIFGLGLLFFAAWLLWRLVRAACDPGEDPEWFSLRLGTARQRRELAPKVAIRCRSALPWVDGLGSIAKVETQGRVPGR